MKLRQAAIFLEGVYIPFYESEWSTSLGVKSFQQVGSEIERSLNLADLCFIMFHSPTNNGILYNQALVWYSMGNHECSKEIVLPSCWRISFMTRDIERCVLWLWRVMTRDPAGHHSMDRKNGCVWASLTSRTSDEAGHREHTQCPCAKAHGQWVC